MQDGVPRSWAYFVLGMRRIEKFKAQENLRMQRAVQMGDGFTRKEDRVAWLKQQKHVAGVE